MPASLANLARRSEVIRAARAFFEGEGFLEVETPLLTPQPLPEANIEALQAEGGFLVTSPEVFMKPLLARGAARIFQISKCFRKDERGARHREEFTMLEWYRQGATWADLKRDARLLVQGVARRLDVTSVSYRGRTVDLFAPWEDVAVEEAWPRFAGHAVPEDDFLFDEEMGRLVEPALGLAAPAFLSGYPLKYCPMAAPCPDRPGWAERCELYIAGLEIANGCTELADQARQRANLEEEQRRRAEGGMRPYPFPEDFAAAMEGFPGAAGMALGLDRLCMLFCGAADIGEVLAF